MTPFSSVEIGVYDGELQRNEYGRGMSEDGGASAKARKNILARWSRCVLLLYNSSTELCCDSGVKNFDHVVVGRTVNKLGYSLESFSTNDLNRLVLSISDDLIIISLKTSSTVHEFILETILLRRL
jgi:hypothetical protein